jgi:hypothetical protein
MALEYNVVQNDEAGEWKRLRRNGDNLCRVNGSDAGIIAGFSRYKSPDQLFFEILNRVEFVPTEATENGHYREPYIAKLYEQVMQCELVESGYCVPLEDNENFLPGDWFFIGVSFDRINTNPKLPDVEIKAPFFGPYKRGYVQPTHMAQLHVQMAVRNKKNIHYIAAFYPDRGEETECSSFFIVNVVFCKEYWQRLYTMMKCFALHLLVMEEKPSSDPIFNEFDINWPEPIVELLHYK